MVKNIQLENLEIYKQIVDHITESLWIGDEKNNTIYTNSIFCDITGYSQTEVLGKKYYDFWDTKSISIIEKNHSKIINNQSIKYEATLKTKKGDLIPVLCSGNPTQNGGIVLMISDISELKSLKQAEKDLIKLNKTKDEFISIVGHELRTPLTSIRGYLSMILEGDMGKINSEVKKSLNHSYNSSVRLIQLVNDVLSIGKIEAGKMEYDIEIIKINNIIESVYNDIHLEIEHKGIQFNIETDDKVKDIKINIDKNKLKQVLLNLLTNAYKFTDKGGKITLKITTKLNKVQFSVIDTGIGIPEDKLKILFSKFSQVESSLQRQNTSGLGLGLAISKKFINAFDSEIQIESELGKGSNFYFDLEIVK